MVYRIKEFDENKWKGIGYAIDERNNETIVRKHFLMSDKSTLFAFAKRFYMGFLSDPEKLKKWKKIWGSDVKEEFAEEVSRRWNLFAPLSEDDPVLLATVTMDEAFPFEVGSSEELYGNFAEEIDNLVDLGFVEAVEYEG